MTPSASLEGAIRRWVDRLACLDQRIERYVVTVEQPHHHHRQGNPFHIHVDLRVPGREPIAANATHDSAYAAVSEAFRAARRQLQDHIRMRRGDVKQHVA